MIRRIIAKALVVGALAPLLSLVLWTAPAHAQCVGVATSGGRGTQICTP